MKLLKNIQITIQNIAGVISSKLHYVQSYDIYSTQNIYIIWFLHGYIHVNFRIKNEKYELSFNL